MCRLARWCGIAAVAWPLLCRAQTPDLGPILQRLDRLERENRDLRAEVQALRDRLDGVTAAPAAPGGAAPVPLEQQIEVQQARIDDLAQTKVESAQKVPVRLTGMVLFNAFANSRQSGGLDYPVIAAPAGPRHDGGTMRQTILGLEFHSPGAIWGGTVRGSVYMDFFGLFSFTQVARFRTGDIEIDWKSRSFMVGVEKPIFNPREPSSLAQVGVSPLTGAGNLWLWLPQARFEQDWSFTEKSGLRARIGVLQTREVAPYPGALILPSEAARPAAEGRFEYFYNWDDERRIEIAPGFHFSQTHAGGQSIPSRLFSVDWFANPWKRVEFTGFFYDGQNVAPLGNGFGLGFYYYGRFIDAVPSIGGWAQVTLHALPRLDFHWFAGQQQNQSGDLPAGLIGRNLLYGGNLFYRLAPNVLLGLETTQVRTVYLGRGTLINNHYDLALAYLF